MTHMPENPTESKQVYFDDYVKDQGTRIEAFKLEYEKSNNTTLGEFPYAASHKYVIPEQTHFDPYTNPRQAAAERILHEYVVAESEKQGVSREQEDPRFQTGEYDNESSQNIAVLNLMINQDMETFEEAEDVMQQTLNVVDGKDNPTLDHVKALADQGVELTPSINETEYAKVKVNMKEHYTQHQRPSEQMELLIAKAENEARTLDHTLDEILELEAQGVQNPLAEPEVASENVSPNTSREHELLKTLLRKKQPAVSKESSSSKEPSLDADI